MQIKPGQHVSEELRQALSQPALCALMTVASANGSPSPKALAAIGAIRTHLLQSSIAIEELPERPLEQIAKAIVDCDPDPHWRERILRGMTLVALFDGAPQTHVLDLLKRSADLFGVDAQPVSTYQHWVHSEQGKIRHDLLRRGFIRDALSASLRDGGFAMVTASLKVASGHQDLGLLQRYQTLRDYPDHSFGRAYADFITRNQFNFPGDVGGPPPPVHRHDCCHVLGGYGTTAAEEGGVIGFQAGFERRDPFDVLMFVMAEFELGIGVSPFLPGAFGQIDPDRLFAGIAHGSQVSTDLIRDIDPWDHFADPLIVVRERFSIPPRGRNPDYPDLGSIEPC